MQTGLGDICMRGFNPIFTDFPDFIEKITREIWEGRGIGRSLEKYYGPDVIVRASNAIVVGNQGVTAATLATLHEFPDRQLIYEDCIWIGNEDDGFLSSHRLISVMRKQNDGVYGPFSIRFFLFANLPLFFLQLSFCRS